MSLGSLLIGGVAIGCIYALIALAINVVFSARRIVNFAQGDVAMLSGLVVASLVSYWALPYVVGVLLAAFIAACVGIAVERIALRPLGNDETNIAWILAVFAVAILLSNGMVLGFGTEPRQIPSIASMRPQTIAGLQIVPDQLVAIVGSLLCMYFFHLLQTRTLYGKALRAASRDPDMAALLGIPVGRFIMGAFAVSGVMATLAGMLIGPLTFVSPQLGFMLGIKGFAAAALGGLGSFRGAMVGGVILGVAETIGAAYIGSGIKESVALLILCLILVFRPTGLFGEQRLVKL
jgi:branched-chain amino acid transport system permease protein